MNLLRPNIDPNNSHNTRSAAQPITRRDAIKALGSAAGAVAACGLLGSSAFSLAGCGSKSIHGGRSNDDYVSPYDWTGLVKDGDHLEFYDEGALHSRWGIDVSEHQFDIDWAAVAAAGVEFAFVRIGNRGATEGKLNVDDTFFQNALGATQNGITVSGYFFSQALNEQEVVEEVEFTLDQLAQAEQIGCVFEAVAYDHERVNVEGARANDLSGDQLSRNTADFCDRMLMSGYSTLVYGNKRDLLRLDASTLATYPIWYAEYDVDSPTAPFDFTIWQYSNAGSIPGISTRVDLNLWLV